MKSVKQTFINTSNWCFLFCLFLFSSQSVMAEAPLSCDGEITCFRLNKQDGSALITLQNGMTFCESEFPNDIRIRTCQSGTHQSLRFVITGPTGSWSNTENTVNYDSKQFWPAPGTWTVRADLYERDNLGGSRCDTETISFTIQDCSGPCSNAGGDDDGDGVCNNEDCAPNNANISRPGDACNDGNNNTTNDRIQSDCSCAGTPVAPTVDCPNLNANIGDSCNDGNGNTTNDRVQNNCTCAGTPSTSGCSAQISTSGRTITVSNLQGAIRSVKFLSNSFATLQSCDTWGGALCGNTETFTVPACGTYFVQVQTYADWSTPVCNILETINISSDCNGGGGGTPTVDCTNLNANIGDACNDGNANTTNDRVQSNCTCVGTPVAPTVDCTNLNANIGDACNDGNANTTNDRVQSNCTCSGTPTGSSTCDATFRIDGNKIIIENLTAGINAAKILSSNYQVISECNDWTSGCNGGMLMATVQPGDYFVQIQTYRDWSTPLCDIFESISVGGSTPRFDCSNLNANIGDACNDGNSNTTNDRVQSNCTCAGTPVAPTVDCTNLNANIGDACNDGNGNTTNDRVQSNCTCAGTPVAPAACTPGELAIWDLDACVSDNRDGNNSHRDFSELVARTTRNGFNSVNASILMHDDNLHSCTQGISGAAACSGIRNDCSFSSNSDDAFRFTITLSAPNGQMGRLTGLNFYERAPLTFSHLSGNTGDNDPPSMYGVRVLRNGREIYRNIDNRTTSGWTLEQFNLEGDSDFEFTGSATFEFELLGYCRSNGDSGTAVWDLDEIRIFGCTSGSTPPAPTFDCANLGANIGDACNDGDPNTTNDTVQSNCTCAGTPTNTGGGGACNIVITSGANFIEISGVRGGPFPTVGILNANGTSIFSCHAFNGGCPETVRVENLPPGSYWVNANVAASDFSTIICDAFEDIRLGSGRAGNDNINAITEEQTIAIAEVALDFKVYPNPASESINVSLENYIEKDITIQMVDYTGRPLKSIDIDNVENTSYTIPINRMSDGIYTVRILSEGIKPLSKKVIVNKRF